MAYKNILVPTDFSKTGNHAIKTAVELCKNHGAVLHIVHVLENMAILEGSGPEPGISLPAVAREIDAEARSNLYNIYESILRSAAIQVQIHMPTGVPIVEICKAAKEMPIDLIVISTHGASGFREFFMGTTAYSVIKNTLKPVLTIPGDFEKTHFEKILFPVRPVPGIKEKFELVQQFLDKMNPPAIHIAELHETNKHAGNINNKDPFKDDIALLQDHNLATTREKYTCSNFASTVLELAQQQGADLIVINATLDYKWTQFFIGPYTQQVVNHAKTPVLSFRHVGEIPSN